MTAPNTSPDGPFTLEFVKAFAEKRGNECDVGTHGSTPWREMDLVQRGNQVLLKIACLDERGQLAVAIIHRPRVAVPEAS